MLSVDSPAPVLHVTDTDGRAAPLTSLAGPVGLLVYLMRTTTCPVCNAHVGRLEREKDSLDAAGVRLAVAVPDDAATAARWRERRRVAAPVLPDGDVQEWAGFGRRVAGTLQQSGTVLVDAAGIVRHVHRATMPPAALDLPRVRAAVASLAGPGRHAGGRD